MSRKLTSAEIKLVGEFEQFLRGLVVDGVTSASVSWIGTFPTANVQDKHESFGGDYESKGLAARLQSALDKHALANPNAEERKAARIADLQRELARLTEAA